MPAHLDVRGTSNYLSVAITDAPPTIVLVGVLGEELFDADVSHFANEFVVVRNYFGFALFHHLCSGFDNLRFIEAVVLPVVVETHAVILSDELLDFFD